MKRPSKERLKTTKTAVINVGNGGRGFIVAGIDDERYVITAAHCIYDVPDHDGLPRPHLARNLAEETYRNIIGPRDSEQTIWATLLFADPMSDIAVFGEPANQELTDEYEKYGSFARSVEPIRISATPMTLPTYTFGEVAEGEVTPKLIIEEPPETPAFLLPLKDGAGAS